MALRVITVLGLPLPFFAFAEERPCGDPAAMNDGWEVALDSLVRNELFEPLGITDFEWIRFPSGEPMAASGLQRPATFYGYQFWLGRSFVRGRQIDWVAGWGYGGQRLFILPALDIVLLVHADRYDSSQQSAGPMMVLNRYVLQAAGGP